MDNYLDIRVRNANSPACISRGKRIKSLKRETKESSTDENEESISKKEQQQELEKVCIRRKIIRNYFDKIYFCIKVLLYFKFSL